MMERGLCYDDGIAEEGTTVWLHLFIPSSRYFLPNPFTPTGSNIVVTTKTVCGGAKADGVKERKGVELEKLKFLLS